MTETEMQPAIVLAGEAHSTIDGATLLHPRRLEHDLGADRAAVASRSGERELDPMIAAVGAVAIENRRLVLVRDDHVEHTAVRQIGECHGASVGDIGHADGLRDVGPAGETAEEIHP
jgi:hypothetical protein